MLIEKHGTGTDWDSNLNHFFHEVISPNGLHSQEIITIVEHGFYLKEHSKSHTSASTDDKFQTLLSTYKDEQLHYFRSSRS
jgi:hypothetical protein